MNHSEILFWNGIHQHLSLDKIRNPEIPAPTPKLNKLEIRTGKALLRQKIVRDRYLNLILRMFISLHGMMIKASFYS